MYVAPPFSNTSVMHGMTSKPWLGESRMVDETVPVNVPVVEISRADDSSLELGFAKVDDEVVAPETGDFCNAVFAAGEFADGAPGFGGEGADVDGVDHWHVDLF